MAFSQKKKKKNVPKQSGAGRGIGYPLVAIPRYHTITISEKKWWKLCEVQVAGESYEIAINLAFLIKRIGHLKWVSCHIKGKRLKQFNCYFVSNKSLLFYIITASPSVFCFSTQSKSLLSYIKKKKKKKSLL